MIVQAVWGLALLICHGHAQQQVVFNTLSGRVRGERTTVNGTLIDVLLSIPYAKPPFGDLRFKPPQPVEPWTGVLNATKPSPACLQLNPHEEFEYELNDQVFNAATVSEDCLYLNIWKPYNTTRDTALSVMLHIHGGIFNYGLKDVSLYSGQFYTAKYDVIVVSINYRVGFLGFGYLGQDTLPGNLGLLDQLEAMKWVHNNIEYFGGDPKKITIFGANAGSWSVGLHLISPLSAPYFDKAILQGGSPLNRILDAVVYPKEASREYVKAFAGAIGCPKQSDLVIYTCLMNASIETLVDGIQSAMSFGVTYFPVVDGHFLPEPPLDLMKRGHYKKTNVLMGVTKQEYSFFLKFSMDQEDRAGITISFENMDYLFGNLPLTNGWNDKQKADALIAFYGSSVSNPQEEFVEVLRDIGSDLVFVCPVHLHATMASKENDVYYYVFNYRGSTKKVYGWAGGYDLEPTFGIPFNLSRTYPDKDMEVSHMIMTYWTNFAKTGNPNSPLSVTTNWPTFNNTDQIYMEVNPDGSFVSRKGPRRHECAFINEILPNLQDELTTPEPCEGPQQPTNKGCNVRLDITGVLAAAVYVMMNM